MEGSSHQEIGKAEKSQVIDRMQDSTAISVQQMQSGSILLSGAGQVTIYQSPSDRLLSTEMPAKLGTNPYKGLLAFQETDGDRFFGREKQVEALWEKLRELYEDETKTRFLAVYGPSGSGKSSLVRAGLVPQLVRQPLPGREGVRVATMIPGTRPLEALAMVLARIAMKDPAPVAKSEEFLGVLKNAQKGGKRESRFQGLRKIAAALPDIDTSPLIILVDQFEEIYSLDTSTTEADSQAEREQKRQEREEKQEAFIGNLLHAASDRGRQVSVVVTFRSDFLGELQRYPRLNRLFSELNGYLVSPMLPEELREAIAKPAERAGHLLEEDFVNLLLEQVKRQEHALPLLQFALMRIWEGLEKGVQANKTLTEIGEVGAALAGEAQRLYAKLAESDRILARRIFLGLVQLGEGTEDTRRRAILSEFMTKEEERDRIEAIVQKFAAPGVRFLAVSSNSKETTIEVAHEALIRNWGQLREWLEESHEALRQKRKIERSAREWQEAKGYLLEGRPLRDAREFMQKGDRVMALSSEAVEFVKKSRNKQWRDRLKILAVGFVLPLMIAPFGILQFANWEFYKNETECIPNLAAKFLIRYLLFFNYKNDDFTGMNFCKEVLSNVNFSDRNEFLENVNFSRANMSDALFVDLSLSNINFFASILNGADFREATLIDTRLNRASLDFADFRGAALIGVFVSEKTSFQDTFFDENTVFINSDLSKTHLEYDQIHQVKICKTQLPENLQRRIHPKRDCLHPRVKFFTD